VQNHNDPPVELTTPTEASEATPQPWHFEVSELLTQAATLCIEHGLELDAYLSGAWAAYVDARPGMRHELEELHLRDQLDELRKLGRMAKA
jgi:hypothetical protein